MRDVPYRDGQEDRWAHPLPVWFLSQDLLGVRGLHQGEELPPRVCFLSQWGGPSVLMDMRRTKEGMKQ